MFTKLYCGNHFRIFVSHFLIMYTLNLYITSCGLLSHKAGRRKRKKNVQSLSCVQLFYDHMDSSPQGSSVHGVSQARILQWVAIFFTEPTSPALEGRFFTTEPPGKSLQTQGIKKKKKKKNCPFQSKVKCLLLLSEPIYISAIFSSEMPLYCFHSKHRAEFLYYIFIGFSELKYI